MGELLHLITDFLVQWFVDFENKCSNICQNLVQNKIGRWAQATQNHLSYGCCEIAVTQATQNHLSYGCCELAVEHSKQENEKFDSSEFWSIRVPWFTFFFSFSLSLFSFCSQCSQFILSRYISNYIYCTCPSQSACLKMLAKMFTNILHYFWASQTARNVD